MRYITLATDYDGTLASQGQVAPEVVAALERLRQSGRRLVMVTGRQLPDLQIVFPHLDLFEWVVAENGGLLYRPAERSSKRLADPPPAAFVEALRRRGVEPLAVGEVVVATWRPHEVTALEVIRELGLEHQVIFNKGSVMILPPGVNKATGLDAALAELEMSSHNTVGIGDAENDHAFLSRCECAVAVSNALPMLKEQADWVTAAPAGAGVVELIEQLLSDDLRAWEPRLGRHDILVGHLPSGEALGISPYGLNMLISGPSGSGKSTATLGFMERLAEAGYQFCLVDPEGDYERFEKVITLHSTQQTVSPAEVAKALRSSAENVGVNLLNVPMDDRPGFFSNLLAQIQELRVRKGRPHWLVADEAHHLLPAQRAAAPLTLPQEFYGLLMVTFDAERASPGVLARADVVLAVGDSADRTIGSFCRAVGEAPPEGIPTGLAPGEAVVWLRRVGSPPVRVRLAPSNETHRRHLRKYALGELKPDDSFYFRGPDGKLNLRAQNLQIFLQMAEGVDDATWLHHLRRGDVSLWFRESIKDQELAEEAALIEEQSDLPPDESRRRVRAAIEDRYTQPEHSA